MGDAVTSEQLERLGNLQASGDGIKEAAGADTEHAQTEQRCQLASADVLHCLPAPKRDRCTCQ